MAAGIYLDQNQYITIENGYIQMDNNKMTGTNANSSDINSSTNENHMYDIFKVTSYTNYTNDAASTAGIIKQVDGTKIDILNTKIKNIAFNTKSNNEGVVYSMFNADNVSGWTENIYSQTFFADIYKDNSLLVGMYKVEDEVDSSIYKRFDVVIKFPDHEHYICGFATTSECNHEGIDSHSQSANKNDYIVKYTPITQGAVGTNWTYSKGGYVLKSDINSSGNTDTLTLTGNLYICLNGYTWNLRKHFQGVNNMGYGIYICNCSDKEATVINSRGNDGALFNQNYLSFHMLAAKAPITYQQNWLMRSSSTHNANDNWDMYNVNCIPYSSGWGNDSLNRMDHSTMATNKYVMSSCSITGYKMSTGADNDQRSFFSINYGEFHAYNVTVDNCTGNRVIRVDNSGKFITHGKFVVKNCQIGTQDAFRLFNINSRMQFNGELILDNNTLYGVIFRAEPGIIEMNGKTKIINNKFSSNHLFYVNNNVNAQIVVTGDEFTINNNSCHNSFFTTEGTTATDGIGASITIDVKKLSICDNTITLNERRMFEIRQSVNKVSVKCDTGLISNNTYTGGHFTYITSGGKFDLIAKENSIFENHTGGAGLFYQTGATSVSTFEKIEFRENTYTKEDSENFFNLKDGTTLNIKDCFIHNNNIKR